MKLSEAQKEFRLRHDRWAIAEFDKEIDAGFPNLLLHKAGLPYEVYQVMQECDASGQRALARALLKRNDKTREEVALCSRVRLIGSNLDAKWQRDITERRLAGEKVKLASMPRLRKAVIAKFTEIFGNRFARTENRGDGGVSFEMKSHGWIVSAGFNFGTLEKYIQYWLTVDSEAKIPYPHQPEILHSALRLDNWLVWLCFGKWERIREEDVDPMSACAVRFCGYMFDAMPKLLEGLDSDRLELDH